LSIRLTDAKEAFYADADALEAYNNFIRYNGADLEKKAHMEIELKKRLAVHEYLKAQEDYNTLIQGVVDVFNREFGINQGHSGCGGCGCN